ATRALTAAAAEAGIPVTVDASSTTLLDALGPDAFRRSLADVGAAVLFANAEEAACVGPPFPPGMLTVVKRGPDPVSLHRPDGTTATVPVPTRVAARDTTGAGDAFAAGFLVAWSSGATDVEAARA